MKRLLRIDASSRFEQSRSRQLADFFFRQWLSKCPDDIVTIRDIVRKTVGHISDSTISGFYTPPGLMTSDLLQATALSDELIREIQESDIIVIGTPIYNFSVPSALKAWIDQIVRINRTFAYDGTSFAGMLKPGKKLVLICAYGGAGYLDNGPFSSADFLQPYLKFLFEFMGISEVITISVEATTADELTVASAMENAEKRILETVEMLLAQAV